MVLGYIKYLESGKPTVVNIFEQYSSPLTRNSDISPEQIIYEVRKWDPHRHSSKSGSLDLIPSRLELAWTLRNPTSKDHLLNQFLQKVNHKYDLIIIDCAPTESILTIAAYRASDYVIVPVKPEFLATIGLPLLARSLKDYREMFNDHTLKMAGIIFNGKRRSPTPPAQIEASDEVRNLADKYDWYVFDSEAYYSDSYPTGSKDGTPIFLTDNARYYVKDEFFEIGEDFLNQIGIEHNN